MIHIEAKFEVIGKPEAKQWKMENASGTTFKLNVAQNDGVDVATIKCPQKVYDTVRRGDVAIFHCTYSDFGDKSEFKIADIVRFEVAGNAAQPAPASAVAGQPVKK